MKKQIIFKLYAEVTTTRRGVQSIEKQTEVLLVDYGEEKEWEKYILPRFKSLVDEYRIYACYADEDWRVELWKCDILDNAEIVAQTRILKMNKILFENYIYIYNFPIMPELNETSSDNKKYQIVEHLPMQHKTIPYYDKNGSIQEFDKEFEAWEYIWGNNLISL